MYICYEKYIGKMEWTGSLNKNKGYKTYKLLSSNRVNGAIATANYTKEGLFRFCYRLPALPYLLNKREVAEGIRNIILFQGKYLLIIDSNADCTTIEFYCKLDQEPSAEKMEKLEKYLFTL